jgi:hypothetical protein
VWQKFCCDVSTIYEISKKIWKQYVHETGISRGSKLRILKTTKLECCMPGVLHAITEGDPDVSEGFLRNVNKYAMFMDLIMFSDVAVFKPVVQVTTLYPYD